MQTWSLYPYKCTCIARPTLVSISPSTINILEGESFQISCQAEGYPAPTYEVSTVFTRVNESECSIPTVVQDS